MKKLLFLLPVFLLADVNPFNAGNLNSSNPYGLTSQEKAILNNKKTILKTQKEISYLKSKIDKITADLARKFVSYDEAISDLKNKSQAMHTIIDEMDTFNKSMIKLKKRVSNLENRLKNLENNITVINDNYKILSNNYVKLNDNYLQLKDTINEIIKIQNQNFDYLTKSMQDILNQMKKTNISGYEAFNEAKDYYANGKLREAKKFFSISLNKNYLPATSSFYLGEIEFKNRKYKSALAFYKKSINLYPKKASFTPKLLLHTGISFEKLGMKQNAELTFKKLINDFPDSKYSNLAKKELEKL